MGDDQSLSSRKSHLTNLSSSNSNPHRDESDFTTDHERELYQPPEVAKQEEVNILRAKILVALIIVIAVSSVGTSTYLLVKDQEKTNFENQFAGYSSKILTVSRQKADQLFSALDAFSASIASQAAAENALRNTTWPYYVIPDWSIKARQLAELTGVSDPEVTLVSFVQAEERTGFNEFAQHAIPKWYQESINIESPEMTAMEFWHKTIPFIHFYDSESNFQPTPVTRKSESQVLFQVYPLKVFPGVPVMPIMYDSTNSGGANALADISKAIRKPTIGFTVLYGEDNARLPGSVIVQPIYDTANTEAADRKMVAFTGIRLHWLDFFKRILTDGEFGTIVVVQSSCPNLRIVDIEQVGGAASSIVSYRIDGQNVEYLGDSDMHNPKYDDMEDGDIFVDLGIDESHLPEDTCIPTLTLHVYPSEDLEQSFQTPNVIIYTAVVVVIFIFTSLVFLLYDYFVRRRQMKVMERIVRQDKIVSNVFPTAIRDRLYKSQEKLKRDKIHRDIEQDFHESFQDLDFEGGSNIYGSAPLADLFPSITVVFADIAGFTAWSSAREPGQLACRNLSTNTLLLLANSLVTA
eukprot:scaffold18572_cov129-Cylindrotheca_fusiformis.AAC.1